MRRPLFNAKNTLHSTHSFRSGTESCDPLIRQDGTIGCKCDKDPAVGILNAKNTLHSTHNFRNGMKFAIRAKSADKTIGCKCEKDQGSCRWSPPGSNINC
jgi:hypothetical protein